jgi:hypothetical protein
LAAALGRMAATVVVHLGCCGVDRVGFPYAPGCSTAVNASPTGRPSSDVMRRIFVTNGFETRAMIGLGRRANGLVTKLEGDSPLWGADNADA